GPALGGRVPAGRRHPRADQPPPAAAGRRAHRIARPRERRVPGAAAGQAQPGGGRRPDLCHACRRPDGLRPAGSRDEGRSTRASEAMTGATLVLRGLRFYRRTHLGVVAGCAISAAVLVGALFVGDSVRGTLERIALARLGRVHSALDSGGRYFRDGLAGPMRGGPQTDGAALLPVQGIALKGRRQVKRVEVAGVDASFCGLAPKPPALKLAAGQVALNRKLADALGAKPGDDVALRMFKPGFLSREAPLASRKEKETRRSLVSVAAVL